MNQDSISFDLGCNFDYKLFDFVDEYDKKHAITSFFGKLKFDGLPGGRTASIIPDFTLDQLADYVNECKKRDITFNYLINPLSMDQNEIDLVLFFCDPDDVNGQANLNEIARLCDRYSIPFASNVATAEVLIQGLRRGDLDWRNIVNPHNH